MTLPEGADPLEFRDPKIWFEEGFFYVVTANKMNSGSVFLHRSKNLLHWEFCSILDSSLGELGNMWECPDFFSLNGKQILLISPVGMKTNGEDFHPGHGTICCIGEYDKGNYSFKRENHHLIDYGIDFYAPQTMKTSDGRRIMIGWMQAWSTSTFVPEEAKYFGQMTVPRELTVVNGKLYQNPVRELKNYRQAKVDYFDVAGRTRAIAEEEELALAARSHEAVPQAAHRFVSHDVGQSSHLFPPSIPW